MVETRIQHYSTLYILLTWLDSLTQFSIQTARFTHTQFIKAHCFTVLYFQKIFFRREKRETYIDLVHMLSILFEPLFASNFQSKCLSSNSFWWCCLWCLWRFSGYRCRDSICYGNIYIQSMHSIVTFLFRFDYWDFLQKKPLNLKSQPSMWCNH